MPIITRSQSRKPSKQKPLSLASSPIALESERFLQKTQSAINGKLCKSCRKIDFDLVFRTRIRTFNGAPIQKLDSISSDVHHIICPLCRFFSEVGLRHPSSSDTAEFRGYHLRAFCHPTGAAARGKGNGGNGIALAVLEGSPFRKTYMWGYEACKSKGFVAQESLQPKQKTQSALFQGCRVNSSRINYERLLEWLDFCDKNHMESCKKLPRDEKLLIHCIDCTTRDLVELPPDDDYLALSYVWGPASIETQQQTEKENLQALKKLPLVGIPPVIEDAMRIAKALKYRYLWVDKYCIDQRDSYARHHQIRNMDLIYAQAHVTLVAGSSPSASFGMHGVSTVPRSPQPSIVVGRRRLVSTLPSLSSALEHSVWTTRGWTYQEATLSRRCLFFTNIQVYFVCGGMTCCEAVHGRATGDNNSESSKAESVLSADIFGDTQPGPELRKFADHVKHYTCRDLTFDSDVLDAFRGILSKSKFPNYYGIPIAPRDDPPNTAMSTKDLNMGFARGLYWLPKKTSRWRFVSLSRRERFPSWSWVGWKGSIQYSGKDGPAGTNEGSIMQPLQQSFDTRFWAEADNGESYSFDQLYDSGNKQASIPELSGYIRVEAWVMSLCFQPGCWGGTSINVCYCHPNSRHKGLSNMRIGGNILSCANNLRKRVLSTTD